MKLKNGIILIASALTVCTAFAAKMETKTAVDPNGYQYRYVTNDPFNARIYTLKNGLTVYLSRIPVQPKIAYRMLVRAGLADSPADATGLAHYLEHMLFKGTDRIGALDYAKEKPLLDKIEQLFEEKRKTDDPKKKEEIYAEIDRLSSEAAKYAVAGEYDSLISSIGGTGLNAGTGLDYTAYVVDIPAQELPKLLQLESARWNNPVMRLFHTELETVYEEFNKGKDIDQFMVSDMFFSRLFAPHPYSWVPSIGQPEHLKNPSITEISAFLKKYYVAPNMALMLIGDLDFDPTIQLVDKYFSGLPTGPVPKRNATKPAELTADQRVTLTSPGLEFLYVTYRFDPGLRNELLVNLLLSLLYNKDKTGLLNTDLIRTQKVQSASAWVYIASDGAILALNGRPKKGQTLDQLADLLKAELRKVQNGEFDEELLKAIILNYRKQQISERIRPSAAEYMYLDTFINGQDYAERLRMIDDMGKIGKKEIMEFARNLKYCVRVDKVAGEADKSGRLPKLKITPVTLNSGKNSDYGKAFLAQKPAPLPELDVIDFNKDFSILPMTDGDRLFYSNRPSPVNDTLFSLRMYVDAGSHHDPLLPLAIQYLNYLGTEKYSAEALRREFYNEAVSFSFSCNDRRSSLNLSGFGSKMERALELANHFLRNVKPDEKAWQDFVTRTIHDRTEWKKDFGNSIDTLNTYVIYGPEVGNNPFKFAESVSEKSLRKLTGKQMVELVQRYFLMPRFYSYAGPEKAEELKTILENRMARPVNLTAMTPPEKHKFTPLPMEQPRIFLLPYDSTQLFVGFHSRAEKFTSDPVRMAKIQLFNLYFSGGLDGVVFREIREARGLAYSAWARYAESGEKDCYDTIFGYIRTQPDKFFDVADQMLLLFRKMPLDENKIDQSKARQLKVLSSSRAYGDLSWIWFLAEKKGVKRHLIPDIFAALQKLTPQDIADFAEKELASRQYDIFVVGPVDKLDRKKLKKYGEVHQVTPEQIFGY